MSNPTGNKLEKLIFGMFDQMVEGADKYVTKQGSTWLIFTEDKRWVIEFTNDKTLWFNYNVFQSELDLIGKDCTEERDLIKSWFESRFLNKPKVEEAHHVDVMKFFDKKMENTIENGVKDTATRFNPVISLVEDTIENGVKETTPSGYLGSIEMKGKIVHQIESPKQNNEVEDTIENGVKNTEWYSGNSYGEVKDTIENGVKNTSFYYDGYNQYVEDTIENGVKETQTRMWPPVGAIDDTIQNGVKETKENRLIRTISVISTIKNGVKHVEDGDWLDQDERIDDIIENGVKEVRTPGVGDLESTMDFMNENNTLDVQKLLNDVIENGVKEVKEISNFDLTSEIFKVNAKRAIRDGVKELKELPDKSGEFRGYGDYYHRQEDITKPHTEYVKEVIEDSYNHMGRVEGVIRNTDKDGI